MRICPTCGSSVDLHKAPDPAEAAALDAYFTALAKWNAEHNTHVPDGNTDTVEENHHGTNARR